MNRLLVVIGAVLFMAATSAFAVPVTWTLSGVTFSDGGTASGSFVYDADTNTYSAVHIETVAGSSPNASLNTTSLNYVCTAPCTGPAPSANNVLVLSRVPATDLTNTPALALNAFGAPLTNAGGSIAIIGGGNALCVDATCSDSADSPVRTIVTGAVIGAAQAAVTTAVPTLSDTALLACALLIAAVAGFGQRRINNR